MIIKGNTKRHKLIYKGANNFERGRKFQECSNKFDEAQIGIRGRIFVLRGGKSVKGGAKIGFRGCK